MSTSKLPAWRHLLALAAPLLLLALALYWLLPRTEIPLASAPPAGAPAPAPACPEQTYADAAALLAALPGARYECAEQLAASLRPLADAQVADALLRMAREGAHDLERRNALRVLGRLAESPQGSPARELVLRDRGADVQATALELLASEDDNFLLQDAVWLLDAHFFPSYSAAPALEGVAARPGLAPALRYRAATARARLVAARPDPLAPEDREFILAGLRSDDPGVRAAAATAVANLRDGQLSGGTRAALAEALSAAWSAEPPLSLAPDDPDPRDAGLLGFQESSPTSLTARAAIARARDRLGAGRGALEELRRSYERLALPYSMAAGDLTLRAGLRPGELPELISELTHARAALGQILGPELDEPLPGEGAGRLTVVIFARQGIYRDYMRAFTDLPAEVDGTYDEATGTLYTHQRTAAQSENTLLETLRHELAHHEAARRLFPGGWGDPGYHAEPKGWADEGLAELLAGLGDAGPAPRPRQLARLCAAGGPPDVAALLARREGYDRLGRFDYDGAWALSYYLLSERPEALRRLYRAYRGGGYSLERWGELAGVSVAEAQAELGAALGRWCA